MNFELWNRRLQSSCHIYLVIYPILFDVLLIEQLLEFCDLLDTCHVSEILIYRGQQKNSISFYI